MRSRRQGVNAEECEVLLGTRRLERWVRRVEGPINCIHGVRKCLACDFAQHGDGSSYEDGLVTMEYAEMSARTNKAEYYTRASVCCRADGVVPYTTLSALLPSSKEL